ncbi:cysteine--tRNA ligase [Candidatus Daviesbacteria bacterium]|nr:cysteine--tRNA ligase [Candidatus Daviesbacteria bacterium]
MLRLYNTLSKKIEQFIPLNPPRVGMYSCGPTVYDYTHIGHLRKYTGDDLLRRILEANNYEVKLVMNITDVGHLVSDEDSGEDKMEKGARETGRTVWEVAKFYEDYFWKSVDGVNIKRPNIVAKATDHIEEQIKLIHKLEKNGFIYQTDQAIYFDISKFPDYTKLSGQKLEEKETGVREDVVVDKQKKNPYDFALWFFTVGHFTGHTMRWSSPWGEGFPGWHIECSAMSMEYLGDCLDIHTGGIDHIPVHHTNEIAQSEAATGKPFVKYWVHHNFLIVDGEKMSKSKKNFYRIDEILQKGFDPLALRYLFLTAHYRDRLNFTWESLQAAQNALNNLRETIRDWSAVILGSEERATPESLDSTDSGLTSFARMTENYYQKFMDAVNNDLNTPQALAVLWDMVKSENPSAAKSKSILEMDKILGLKLDEYLGRPIEVPKEVQKLINKREQARKSGNFEESDKLRHEIKKLGFEVKDTPSGTKVNG